MAAFLWWCHVKTTQQSIVSCGTHYSRETSTKQPSQVHGTLSPRCKQRVISGLGCLAGIALLHKLHEAIMTVGRNHVTNGQIMSRLSCWWWHTSTACWEIRLGVRRWTASCWYHLPWARPTWSHDASIMSSDKSARKRIHQHDYDDM